MTESGDEGEVVVHDTEVSFLIPIYYKPFALLVVVHDTEVSFLETNILQTIRITITNTKLQEFYLPGEGNTVP